MPLPGIREADQIARALGGVRAVIAWLRARGIKREEIIALIDKAEAEGRDVSEGEIIDVLDRTDARIEEIKAGLNKKEQAENAKAEKAAS